MSSENLQDDTKPKSRTSKRIPGDKPGNGIDHAVDPLKEHILRPIENVAKAIKIQKGNTELAAERITTLMTASAAYNRGLHDMQLAYVELFQSSMELMQRAARDLVRCMNPADFAEVQRDMLREGLDHIFVGTSKILQTSSQAAENASRPIQDRIGSAS